MHVGPPALRDQLSVLGFAGPWGGTGEKILCAALLVCNHLPNEQYCLLFVGQVTQNTKQLTAS